MIRLAAIWGAIAIAVFGPILAAAFSPLLQWRDPIYILAGFSGVGGLSLMLLQPLILTGQVPGLRRAQGRRAHRWIGIALVGVVIVHVVGLWITSPPDVVDVLLLRSPTPFSLWGVIAMWAVFAAAALVALRHRIGMRMFRLGHTGLVLVIVAGTILHALLIDGTMEPLSKAALCLLVAVATLQGVAKLRVWRVARRR